MRRGNPILRVAGVAYRPSVTVIRSVVTLLALASCAAMTTAAGAKTSICGGTRVPIDTSVLGTPFTNLTLGGNDGSFLIDTGATYSLVDMRRYGLPEDTKIFLSGFSLPLVQSGTFVAVDLSLFAAPLGGQLGTVGTDFLSLHSLEFHYEPSQPFAALGSEACNPATLRRAGFVAVGLPGYYATDLSRLKNGMPNVPVIGLRIGQVTFPTQVDTGYGDFPKGVIQVNAALMKILRASGIPMHPVPSDVVTVGCSGSYAYERWQIERADLSIITPGGVVVASYAPPLLELKTDARCSGISAFVEPFAQIGAFWLSRWGKTVFDGLSSTVWIPIDQGHVSVKAPNIVR